MKYLKQKDYDECFSNPNNYPMRNNPVLIKTLKGFQFNSLMELGCGNGRNLREIRKHFPEQYLCGTDLSEAGVTICKEHGFVARVGSGQDIPFPEKIVDVTLTYHTLEQMRYIIEETIEEIKRVTQHYVICFEPLFELQNLYGKFHNWNKGFVKGLPFLFEKHNVEILEMRVLNVGSLKQRLRNRTCLLIGKLS